jgi:hypothetical protein
LVAAATASCALDTTGSSASGSPDPAKTIQAAMDDVAQRTGLALSAIRLERMESVTWQDGSMGCPQPDVMYTQMLVPGNRIRIAAGDQTWVYHAATRGAPLLCPSDK